MGDRGAGRLIDLVEVLVDVGIGWLKAVDIGVETFVPGGGVLVGEDDGADGESMFDRVLGRAGLPALVRGPVARLGSRGMSWRACFHPPDRA
jgi:hypothetical protein